MQITESMSTIFSNILCLYDKIIALYALFFWGGGGGGGIAWLFLPDELSVLSVWYYFTLLVRCLLLQGMTTTIAITMTAITEEAHTMTRTPNTVQTTPYSLNQTVLKL